MIEGFGLTDAGCTRVNNEDCFLVDNDVGLYVLADGMGGARGGEIASRLALETLYRTLLDYPDDPDAMQRGYREAHVVIRERASADSGLAGMGTTLVAARVRDANTLEIGSVGDSRAYLKSAGGVQCLTRDQTWVAEVGRKLKLNETALRKHPMRHVLTMALGASAALDVQICSAQMEAGNELLLCSDGLHGVVDEEILQVALFSEKNLEEKCHYLIEAARKEGGPDNITAVLIRVS